MKSPSRTGIEPVITFAEGDAGHLEPSLHDVIGTIRSALLHAENESPRWRNYHPGIGAFTEPGILEMIVNHWPNDTSFPLVPRRDVPYPDKKASCDLCIGNDWAIEFKLLRPFNDNGSIAEHWTEGVLHPYADSTSALGDAQKLTTSAWQINKAVAILAFEPLDWQFDIAVAVRSFELLLSTVIGINPVARTAAFLGPLCHPCHQRGCIYAYQL